MSPAKRLENKAAQMALVNPDLKEVPVYKTREQAEAEQKTAVENAKGRPARRPLAGLPRWGDAPEQPALRGRVRRGHG